MNEIVCPVCNTTNPPGSVYCSSCGRQIGLTVDGDTDSRRYNIQLSQLRRDIEAIVGRIDRLQGQINERAGQTEQRSADVDTTAPTEPESPETPLQQQLDEDRLDEAPSTEEPAGAALLDEQQEPVAASVDESGRESPGTYGQGLPREIPNRPRHIEPTGELRLPRPDFPSIDWERVLGRNWLAIIGAVALAVGIGFFLKLSFDNNWIGDTGRILLGLGVGGLLVGLGEYTSRRAPVWSQAVTAGGAASLYLSIYAAYALYELIRPDAAFYVLGGIVGLAGILAVRYDSRVIGFLGIIGAFIAPVLLGPELPDIRLVLPYIAVVDLGILGVAAVRNWRWFVISGWVGSYGLFAAGYAQYPDTDPLLFQLGLTAIFLIFVGATTLFHITWRRVPGSLDMALVAVNAVAFFGLTTIVLAESYDDWLWVVAAAMAVMYGLIALVAYTRPGAPPQTAMITLPISLVFLTVAVPLGLSGVWLTTAWAAQGAILLWSGFVLGRVPMRVFGLGVLALASVHLLAFPPELASDTFAAFVRQRFVVFAFVIAALYVATALYLRFRESTLELEHYARPVLVTVASALTLITLSLAAIHYYGFGAIPIDDWPERLNAFSLLQLTLTWMWALYGAGVLAVGFLRDLRLVRWAGLGLLAISLAKLLIIDSISVFVDYESYQLGLNPQVFAYSMVIAPTAFILFAFRRVLSGLAEIERTAFRAIAVGLHVAVVWGLTLETLLYFASAVEVDELGRRAALDGFLVTLTAIWAVYGAALILVGLLRGMRLARLGGMILVGIAFAKLVLLDTFVILPVVDSFMPVLNLKFMSFVVAVTPVAAIGYVFRKTIRGFEIQESRAFRILFASTNALVVWALMVEVTHFFVVREEQLDISRTEPILLSITVIWALYGLALLSAGLWKDLMLARYGGMGLLGVAVAKIVLFDTFSLFPDEETYLLILNTHFGTNVVTVVALVLGVLAFRRLGASIPERERQVLQWLPAAAGALALWSMSLEAIHFFAVREELTNVNQESGVHLTLTVLWALYGIGVIVIGFLRDASRIRLAGMALLAVPVIKLFVFDVFLLEQIYRVAAFVTLGVLLLGTGLAYQRYSTELRGFLLGRGGEPDQ